MWLVLQLKAGQPGDHGDEKKTGSPHVSRFPIRQPVSAGVFSHPTSRSWEQMLNVVLSQRDDIIIPLTGVIDFVNAETSLQHGSKSHEDGVASLRLTRPSCVQRPHGRLRSHCGMISATDTTSMGYCAHHAL